MFNFDIISQVTKIMSNPENLGTMIEPIVQEFLKTFEISNENQCGCIICARPTDGRICVSIVEMSTKGNVVNVIEMMLLDDFVKKIMKIYKNGNK